MCLACSGSVMGSSAPVGMLASVRMEVAKESWNNGFDSRGH
jgi:hypothetical protein